MAAIQAVHANWIAVIPYAFSKKSQPEIQYQNLSWQWWGERPEGIRESILLAKEAGLKVMLKPQVWIHDEWVGDVDFKTESEWLRWESDYRQYLMQQVSLAIEMKVDMICIATEFNHAAIKREPFFRQLISDIRSMYQGTLCYSANWDHFKQIPFWDALDYIGISAYFPLSYQPTPQHEELTTAWKDIAFDLEQFSQTRNRKILFTEMGYLSVDGCAGKTWELEHKIENCRMNHLAQANAYDALFSTFYHKSFWAGGFIWKWFPNGEGHEGYPDKDYTPQDKPAENILSTWYKN